jgi:lysophospholipase L1-like esterase
VVIDHASRRLIRESAIVFGTNLLARTPGVLASLPVPTDSRSIAVPGPDPHHILLVGSGVVVGSGLASHALGAGGHLARYLSAETGRGVTLDVAPIPSLLLRFAPAHLSSLDLGGYDAVILAVGVNDAFGITSRQDWRRSLTVTLRLLESRLPHAHQVFLLLIADPTPSPLFRRGASRRASVRAESFNAETTQLVQGNDEVTAVGFEIGPTVEAPRPYDSASYLGWVRQMGPSIVEGLARLGTGA